VQSLDYSRYAARLGKYFGTTAQFWLNLQARYELELFDPGLVDSIEPIAA